MRAVDLHTHSKCSDGTYTPSELVAYGVQKGLAALALTDHDTVSGVPEAIKATKEINEGLPADKQLELIPGVELSTEWNGHDIHMVGLYIDIENDEFKKYLQDFLDSRDLRNQKMCKKLQEELGFDISYDKLIATYPGATITRAHYARYLLDKGYTKSMAEAFDRYIGDGKPYFIPREKVTPQDGVNLIHKAKGVAILAHPILYGFGKSTLDGLVAQLKDVGLDGIEAVYSTYSPSDTNDIRTLASKYDLLLSGGSDFHGSNKPHIDLGTGMGKLFVPEEFKDKIHSAIG